MVGEDFGRFGRAGIPIVMYRLGAVDQRRLDRYRQLGQPAPSLHSAQFYPDVVPTLTTGITATSSVVLDLLKPE
jgi:hippurate hydrolase